MSERVSLEHPKQHFRANILVFASPPDEPRPIEIIFDPDKSIESAPLKQEGVEDTAVFAATFSDMLDRDAAVHR